MNSFVGLSSKEVKIMKPKVNRNKVLVAMMAAVLFASVLWSSYAQAEQPPKEVVWALVDALTGPFAASSKEGVNAMEMFLEENKYTIAGYKIKLVLADTELKPAVGVRRLAEVISTHGEKLVFVFSGASSAVQLALCDLIGKKRVLSFGPMAGIVNLLGRWATAILLGGFLQIIR